MAGTVPKELRPLVKRAVKQGHCTLRQTAKNHLQLLDRDGNVITTFPGSTVNRRAVANLRTALRRHGVHA